jgi:CheY-like chemotaxis protein
MDGVSHHGGADEEHKRHPRRFKGDAVPEGRLVMFNAKIERLEDRRLMSGGNVTAATGLADAPAPGAYEFDLGRPRALPLVANPAAGSASDLLAAEFPQFGGHDPQILTGTYTPRVRIWGANATTGPRKESALPQLQKRTEKAVRLPVQPETGQPAHTVLLVEDDELSRRALAAVLRRRGWHVTAVSTLAAAEAQLPNQPEVVILDLTLPDGRGESLLEHIRAAHMPTTVAVTTGVSDSERMRHLDELHPDVVLPKPINVAALLHSLPHGEVFGAA